MIGRSVVTNPRTEDHQSTAPRLADLRAPDNGNAATTYFSGPPVKPEERVYFYPPAEWEQFIYEWATALKPAGPYIEVKQLGGAGDRGVDIAGFKTKHRFKGAWDCFQAKHYCAPLTPSDAYPEMFKIFQGVVDGHYLLPEKYYFVSPKGCGMKLTREICDPPKLKAAFSAQIDDKGPITRGIDERRLQTIRTIVEETDFSMFTSLDLEQLIASHENTRFFSARFGTPLPPRPPIEPTPEHPLAEEARYIEKLVDVYREQDSAKCCDTRSVASHPKYGPQFQRHREAFYSAEALRVYARDSVPDGTYELLQEDVYTGVIDVAETDHPSGLDRMRSVLTVSGQIDLSAHTLVSVSRLQDRQGICHQLANIDRLHWLISDD